MGKPHIQHPQLNARSVKPFYGYMFVFDFEDDDSFDRVFRLLQEMHKKEKDQKNSKNFILPKKIFIGCKFGNLNQIRSRTSRRSRN